MSEIWSKTHMFPWKVPLILVRYCWNLSFLNRYAKNTQTIRPVWVEFHTDGLTGRHDEANSRFSQFCESARDRLHTSEIEGNFTRSTTCQTLRCGTPQRCLLPRWWSRTGNVFWWLTPMLDRGSILQPVLSTVSNYHLNGLTVEEAKLTLSNVSCFTISRRHVLPWLVSFTTSCVYSGTL